MGRLRKNINYENKLFNDDKFFINNPHEFKNNWNKLVFKNNNPIYIEIGSGKGKFIVENAIKYPNINFIAIDKFPTILYKILIKINKSDQPINNLKIVNYDAIKLNEIFGNNEIKKVYLNFSDPWPKEHHKKNRLTNIKFLNVYFEFLDNNGIIEFKTDNSLLYEYTLEVIKENNLKLIYFSNDIYSDIENNQNNIQTEYEIKWLNKNVKIKKIIFAKN